MTGSSNFLQFDYNKINMLDDVTYEASTQVADGNSDGIAVTALHNKMYYQVTTMCAAFAQYMANLGFTVSDASLSTLVTTITSAIGSNSIKISIAAASHGFSVGQVLYYTGSAYALAKADAVGTVESVGIVSSVTDANNFVLTMQGYTTGLSGLTAGYLYYLSASSAGALTATPPTTYGQYVKPLFIADSTTSGYFVNQGITPLGVLPTAPISGLTLSPLSNSTISVSAGDANDSTGSAKITLSGSTTLNMATTGINALDTGTVANNTWYDVYVVTGATGTGVLACVSGNSPTLPAGYNVYKRRIGAIKTNGSSQILDFHQQGNGNSRRFLWGSFQTIYSNQATTNGTWLTSSTSGAYQPTAVTSYLIIHVDILGNNSGGFGIDSLDIRPNGSSGTGVLRLNIRGSSSGNGGGGAADATIPTDSNGDFQILKSGVTTQFVTYLYALGFQLEV